MCGSSGGGGNLKPALCEANSLDLAACACICGGSPSILYKDKDNFDGDENFDVGGEDSAGTLWEKAACKDLAPAVYE